MATSYRDYYRISSNNIINNEKCINNDNENNISLNNSNSINYKNDTNSKLIENKNKTEENFICIIFIFEKYGKHIFIDASEDKKFSEVIELLEEKYAWLKYLKNKAYIYKGKLIGKRGKKKTIKDLKICTNDIIFIQSDYL